VLCVVVWLSVVCCLLSVVCCLLSVVCCLLSVEPSQTRKAGFAGMIDSGNTKTPKSFLSNFVKLFSRIWVTSQNFAEWFETNLNLTIYENHDIHTMFDVITYYRKIINSENYVEHLHKISFYSLKIWHCMTLLCFQKAGHLNVPHSIIWKYLKRTPHLAVQSTFGG
jgi:hypothetical protein